MKSRMLGKRTVVRNGKSKGSFSDLLQVARRKSGYVFIASLGIWLPKSDAATLINVDVTSMPLGAATTLTNTGTIVGDFNSVGAIVPGITNVDGINAAAMTDLAGTGGAAGQHYQGPATPAQLGGGNKRTVEAWIWNPGPRITAQAQPQIQFEKTIVSFGRRNSGGNFAFQHGYDTEVGAVSTVTFANNTSFGGIGWGTQRLRTNNWTYLVATYDGSTLSVYSDGVLRNSETYDPYVRAINTALLSANNSVPTTIRIARQTVNDNGATPSGAGVGPFYLGRLRIQDTNMTGAEVLAQYNAEKAAFNYKDTDTDGMDDWYEVRYGLNPASGADAGLDADGDTRTNLQEFQAGSNPLVADTDGDGLNDAQEVVNSTDPTHPDTDLDQLSDSQEVNVTLTNPTVADSDADGFSDGVEVAKGTNPNSAGSFPAPLVSLDATALAIGPLAVWTNAGTIGGTFDSVSATNRPAVTNVFGINGVNFTTVGGAGVNGTSYFGPAAPTQITGAGARTIEMWIYNGTIQPEETMFSWGGRAGTAPEGKNLSFGEGRDGAFGAAAQWGVPDIGWNNKEVYGRWTELAFTYSGTNGTIYRTYVDGKQVNSEIFTLVTQELDAQSLPYHFRIARQNANSQSHTNIDGTGFGEFTMARVRVFDVGLDEASIKARFDAEKGTFGLADTDTDGMPDWYEDRFGLNKNSAADAAANPDADGLTNLQEYQRGYSVPQQGTVATVGLNPNVADTDGDGVNDGTETSRVDGGQPAPTNPFNRDTDNDGLRDGAETDTGIFLNVNNTGTDPLIADTDGDGFSDGLEVAQGSSPVNPLEVPSPLPIIGLSNTNLPLGQLNTWTNTGRVPGNFVAEVGRAITNSGGIVEMVQGVAGVTLNGGTYRGPAATFVSGDPNYSVEAWVYNPAIGDEETIIGWGTRGGPDGTMSAFTDGSNATWGAMTHWGAPDLTWSGANVRTPARWKHLVYTYDAQTRTQTVYSDATQANQEVLGNALNITDSTDGGITHLPFRLGDESVADGLAATGVPFPGAANPPGFLFFGTIGEINVFTRTLPLGEIQTSFNAGAQKYGILDDDGDTIPTWWERVYGLNPNLLADGAGDLDGDGLNNAGEYAAGSNPTIQDTDSDGLTDNQEVATYGSNPTNPDTEYDGLIDSKEVAFGTSLVGGGDSDGDTYPDGIEVLYGTDPTNSVSMPDTSTPVALVNLDATTLPVGPLPNWTNNNALGWNFVASSNILAVSVVDGTKGVTFDGTDYYTGPTEPIYLAGNSPRTIAAWLWNPVAAGEETVFAWSRRGGTPDGSNCALSHGMDGVFGAAQFWGTPDLPYGTNASQIASNVVQGHWTFVAVTYDPITVIGTVYKDGLPVNSDSVTNAAGEPLATFLYDPSDPFNAGGTPIGRSLPFRVGAQNSPGGAPAGPFATMTIAKIRAYDQTLSAAQIAAQYNAEKVQFPGQPVITNVKVNSSTGILTFDWVPSPGRTYAVETNSNLANTAGWAAEATGQSSGSYTNNNATGQQRYYRLRVE